MPGLRLRRACLVPVLVLVLICWSLALPVHGAQGCGCPPLLARPKGWPRGHGILCSGFLLFFFRTLLTGEYLRCAVRRQFIFPGWDGPLLMSALGLSSRGLPLATAFELYPAQMTQGPINHPQYWQPHQKLLLGAFNTGTQIITDLVEKVLSFLAFWEAVTSFSLTWVVIRGGHEERDHLSHEFRGKARLKLFVPGENLLSSLLEHILKQGNCMFDLQ